MRVRQALINCTVAAFLPLMLLGGPAGAQSGGDTARLDELFEQLQDADERAAARIERQIWAEWSKSGSAAMDLLLERGRMAAEQGDYDAAVEHLTALVDHAPDFAEGWNARALVYFQMGEYGPSVNDIARTLTLNPRHFGALSGLGMIFEQMGDEERALEAYKAALAIHPRLEGVNEAVQRLEQDAAGTEL
jgi:tetratricopeptide (TPR) repeat protein